MLLQHALGELELFLKKFKIVDVDDETTKILSSVVWIDEMSDFVPAKTNHEMVPVLSKDKGRLCFLKVCKGSVFIFLRKFACRSIQESITQHYLDKEKPLLYLLY